MVARSGQLGDAQGQVETCGAGRRTTGRSDLAIDQLGTDAASIALMASLIADRQADLCRRVIGPATRYTNASAVEELLVSNGATRRFGAWRGERLVAFLGGDSNNKFGFASSADHAVARDDPDPGEVYAALYARLADEWLAEGVSVHDVELPVGEVDERAWFDLGFGRRTCFGVRPADMALPPREERVDIRFATDDDIEAIGRLALIEARHRAAPPQYADQGPVYADELIHLHSQLRAEGAEHLLARVRGRDVGVLTLQRTSPAPLLTGDGDPYIGPTGVDASVRGLGVGVQLVSAAVGWARDHRAASLSVAFNPPNIGARQFWRGLGFSPTGWKLARRLPIALG